MLEPGQQDRAQREADTEVFGTAGRRHGQELAAHLDGGSGVVGRVLPLELPRQGRGQRMEHKDALLTCGRAQPQGRTSPLLGPVQIAGIGGRLEVLQP
ncbi:hypothetical protein SAV31267_005120 [Streptomyces avermitilis]|uniref:Uncharacterized protein n=1 Tax=Streptomyces avermitilis TaxID=33903 RepID=A0A4D4MID7_STRAX|nr:hypothetical protein SAV31267_005120 [Streptomyces avermitilis]